MIIHNDHDDGCFFMPFTILMNIDYIFCLFGLYGLQEDDYSRDEIADNYGCVFFLYCVYIHIYIYIYL